MALLNIDPSAIGETIAKTAGGKAAQAIAQRMSPKLVQDVQRILSIGGLIGDILGIGSIRDKPTTLLGGLTLKQAQAIYEQVSSTRMAKKNLWFIRITDPNPPTGAYAPPPPPAKPGAKPSESGIGASLGSITAGVTGALSKAGNALASKLGVKGGSKSVAIAALSTFDLLAVDVAYGSSVGGDSVAIGSGFMDRATGSMPTELQITTLDDEAGSIKRWFDGKLAQVAHDDGTFGLPGEYLVTIEVVHAIPSEQVPNYKLAYVEKMRMRPQAMQIDLSRRDQALAEYPMTFVQFDSFMGT